MSWKDTYNKKLISLAKAAKKIKSGDKIWAGGYLSVPVLALKELDKTALNLNNAELYAGLLTYPYEFLKPEYVGHLTYRSLFMGPLEKKAQNGGNAEIITYHLSNVKEVLDRIDFNVMIVETTPPDENGYMSMGACGGVGNRIVLDRNIKTVITIINKNQPFVGNKENLLHIDDVHFIAEGHHPIAEAKPAAPSEVEIQIAKLILPMIKDGSTIQIGIGGLSNTIGLGLKNHKNLGIHTEMFTESMMELCKAGAVTGAAKNYQPHKIVTAFAAGSQELLDFMDHNDQIKIDNVGIVNNPNEIAKNDNLVSINTCIMIDLTGQVAAEGIGHKQISGTGGQVDFVRATRISKGGLSIITLKSTYKGKDGIDSTIKFELPPGTPVTTLRNDVQIIVTEYGIADLRGLSTVQRAKALINIAHPDFRDELRKAAIAINLYK